jgi:hypothetical protein
MSTPASFSGGALEVGDGAGSDVTEVPAEALVVGSSAAA